MASPLGPEAIDIALAARFGSTKCAEATPVSLTEGQLIIKTGEGRSARLGLERVKAVATGIVEGLGPKPVLVIDLLLNWREADAEVLQMVRLQSNRFDPMKIQPEAAGGLEALQQLICGLVERSGAQPLPTRDATVGGRFERYGSLSEYERAVLDVESVESAGALSP